VTKKRARMIATTAVLVIAIGFIGLSAWQIVDQVFGTRLP
jgi:hypothetical protein